MKAEAPAGAGSSGAGPRMPKPARACLALADGVHAAVNRAGDVVFLALATDRYLCLPFGAARLRLSPEGDRIETEDAALVADLQAMGLLRAGGPGLPRTPPPALPSRDLEPDPVGRFELGDVAAALRCLADALFRYRGRSLAQLTSQMARDRAPPPPNADLTVEARRFRRMVRWLPVPRKCLLQSFLMLRHLRRRGLDAQWVFGVRTWPFEAHCWLQSDDLVLDDHHERLVAYAPILVV